MAALSPEDLARRFHEHYERLAPEYGYKTREETATAWDEVPEPNRALMVATCAAVLQDIAQPQRYASIDDLRGLAERESGA